ncbi:hypothetical protein PAPYR_5229 [Paratrimastix pyriformis]|uniref:GRAM domain-containing protein n=1 Tax=Paratrimastix pyriformis TaxID=342808 RepID=A0ABQ8UKJ2_9EUKA|nr:hypothetical protein PAPYR_5229 [Paratrimastix pyriformis]
MNGYRKMFSLPPSEKFIDDYACGLYRKVLRNGRLYVFTNYVCFYTNAWGELIETIPFSSITDIQLKNTGMIFSNAIEIKTAHDKFFFSGFLVRDAAFRVLVEQWRGSAPDAAAAGNASTSQEEDDSGTTSEEGDTEEGNPEPGETDSLPPTLRARTSSFPAPYIPPMAGPRGDSTLPSPPESGAAIRRSFSSSAGGMSTSPGSQAAGRVSTSPGVGGLSPPGGAALTPRTPGSADDPLAMCPSACGDVDEGICMCASMRTNDVGAGHVFVRLVRGWLDA